MSGRLIPVLFSLSLVTPLPAQTAADLRSKYAHHETYDVRSGAQMTAKFASNGLICEMRLEPAHFNNNAVSFIGLDRDDIRGLLDELVPASERGEEDKNDRSNGMVIGLGQTMEEVYAYTNVRMHVLSSHGSAVAYVKWRHRECE